MARRLLRTARRLVRRTTVNWKLSRLVAANLEDMRAAALAAQAQVDRCAPPRLYVFWAQSIDTAPDIVQLCWQQLRRVHDPAELVVLDFQAARELVDIPPDLLAKFETDLQMVADLLRLELLSRYGGVWADATCLALDDLLVRGQELSGQSGFFAFTRFDAPLANWFLASRPGDYVVLLWREAIYAYWRQFDRKISYFLSHNLFGELLRQDPEFRRRWEMTPRLRADPPLLFQRAMREPYDEPRYRELLGGCFIHKLTYKAPDEVMRGATLVGHLLREGAPPSEPGGARSGAPRRGRAG